MDEKPADLGSKANLIHAPRDEKGRLLKGSSLNPGGRPKGIAQQIRELTNGGKGIFERMNAIWTGEEPGFNSRDRLEAGKWLADRGWGRAVETSVQVEADAATQGAATELATEQLEQLARSVNESIGNTDGNTADASDAQLLKLAK